MSTMEDTVPGIESAMKKAARLAQSAKRSLTSTQAKVGCWFLSRVLVCSYFRVSSSLAAVPCVAARLRNSLI